MHKEKINIIIIESSFILYQGLLKAILSSNLSIQVSQADDLSEAEKTLRKFPESILIANPSIAQYNNKEFQSFRKNWASSHWIAFTYQLFDEQLLSLFDAVININDTPEKITDVIKNQLYSDDSNTVNTTEKLLSEREIEVLKQLALGLSNKEIADKLNISINTVITHRKNISQKTGIKSASGLTIYAVVNKHITLESTI
ncbi:conserved hypothetical protein [uncultured Paludibacter sp.]|nr:conserved hypothetical protein [uncultured Paludibacter sp.]